MIADIPLAAPRAMPYRPSIARARPACKCAARIVHQSAVGHSTTSAFNFP
jgi:hypothetical protein